MKLLFAKATNNFGLEPLQQINNTSSFIIWIILIGICLFVIMAGFFYYMAYIRDNKISGGRKLSQEKEIDELVKKLDALKREETEVRDKLNSIN